MHSYLRLACKASGDRLFLFPVKPKCHVSWLLLYGAMFNPNWGVLYTQGFSTLHNAKAWQEIAYQQELHSNLVHEKEINKFG